MKILVNSLDYCIKFVHYVNWFILPWKSTNRRTFHKCSDMQVLLQKSNPCNILLFQYRLIHFPWLREFHSHLESDQHIWTFRLRIFHQPNMDRLCTNMLKKKCFQWKCKNWMPLKHRKIITKDFYFHPLQTYKNWIDNTPIHRSPHFPLYHYTRNQIYIWSCIGTIYIWDQMNIVWRRNLHCHWLNSHRRKYSIHQNKYTDQLKRNLSFSKMYVNSTE